MSIVGTNGFSCHMPLNHFQSCTHLNSAYFSNEKPLRRKQHTSRWFRRISFAFRGRALKFIVKQKLCRTDDCKRDFNCNFLLENSSTKIRTNHILTLVREVFSIFTRHSSITCAFQRSVSIHLPTNLCCLPRSGFFYH